MSPNYVAALLDHAEWTSPLLGWSGAYEAWNEAHVAAEGALEDWQRSGSAEDYAVYRAAQDREDAAQDALAREG